MRILMLVVSVSLVVLGMWIIGLAFMEPPPEPLPGGVPVASAPQAGPGAQVAIGFAVMVGGVLMIYLGSRR